MFNSAKKAIYSVLLSFLILFSSSASFIKSYAYDDVNSINESDVEQTIDFNSDENSQKRMPNFAKLKIDVNSDKVVFKLTHVGVDKLDKISLVLKIVDANGKTVYNKSVNKSGLSAGTHTLGIFSKGAATVQEDIRITGRIYESGQSFSANLSTWRGNFKGGKYATLAALGGHRHHIPASAALSGVVSSNSAPAIRMTIEDHRKTASYGSSSSAREYRAKQAKLIKQGRFAAAQDMDINDIRRKFGSKYNNALKEAVAYARSIGLR